MPPKNQQRTIIGKRSNKGIYIYAAVIVAVMFIIVGAGTVFALNQEIEAVDDTATVSAVIVVSGNDVVLTIVDAGKDSHLLGASLSISGVTRDGEATYAQFISVKEPIIFPYLAYGVTGDRYVLVKGYFDDYSSDIIISTNVHFG